MSALAAALPMLLCPRCSADLDLEGRTLRCPAGHASDVARQGHVNFLSRPAGAAADDAAMVAARVEVLSSGL
ncbi:MAG: hypothetical protein Q4G43_08340 [Mobilicoccus sp.]|nr:hypothetical protein [Mobilicoccus sp.]